MAGPRVGPKGRPRTGGASPRRRPGSRPSTICLRTASNRPDHADEVHPHVARRRSPACTCRTCPVHVLPPSCRAHGSGQRPARGQAEPAPAKARGPGIHARAWRIRRPQPAGRAAVAPRDRKSHRRARRGAAWPARGFSRRTGLFLQLHAPHPAAPRRTGFWHGSPRVMPAKAGIDDFSATLTWPPGSSPGAGSAPGAGVP